MRFSVPEFLSDISADTVTIGLDMPGGGYDRLHSILEQYNGLPRGKAGRTALVALMLVASRLVKQQLGPMSPLASFVNGIAEDGVREQAKRILETANHASRPEAVWEMDSASRSKLLEQYRRLDDNGRRQLREQMLRSTVTELAVIADIPRDDLQTLLSLLNPETVTPRGPGVIDQFASSLFPWLKN